VGPNDLADEHGIKPLQNEFYYVTVTEHRHEDKQILATIGDRGVLETMLGEPLPNRLVETVEVIEPDIDDDIETPQT
jgi:hypothetical protein